MNTPTPTTLIDVPIGSHARITGFTLGPVERQRLLEMGLTAGASIEVVRYAPLGDPIDIKVRGYHLSLRRTEAVGIHVVLA